MQEFITPGPWEAKYSPHHGIEIYAPSEGRSVASLPVQITDYDTQSANAALIAAAPEMLEGLEAVLELQKLHQRFGDNKVTADTLMGLCEKLKPIVAKATQDDTPPLFRCTACEAESEGDPPDCPRDGVHCNVVEVG